MQRFNSARSHLICLLSLTSLINFSVSVVVSTHSISSTTLQSSTLSTSPVSTTITTSTASETMLTCGTPPYTTLPESTSTASINGSAPVSPCNYNGCWACGVSSNTEGLWCGFCPQLSGSPVTINLEGVYQLNSQTTKNCCYYGYSTFCAQQYGAYLV